MCLRTLGLPTIWALGWGGGVDSEPDPVAENKGAGHLGDQPEGVPPPAALQAWDSVHPPRPFPGSSINPVTGRVEEKPPNPMEGMTEEQKEHEAMKLVTMFDRLSRCVSGRRATSCPEPRRRGQRRPRVLASLCYSCLASPVLDR